MKNWLDHHIATQSKTNDSDETMDQPDVSTVEALFRRQKSTIQDVACNYEWTTCPETSTVFQTPQLDANRINDYGRFIKSYLAK